ncbi:cyclin-L2 isoform X5 [Cebus imitator]|uniref:cyclin-L2 isoform X5 n=1 Tax=Cebus imitator TaxID=2715852 RepID=UPI00189AA73D|nr:cyclin-L2 isoform X5 [Cebus imitator]
MFILRLLVEMGQLAAALVSPRRGLPLGAEPPSARRSRASSLHPGGFSLFQADSFKQAAARSPEKGPAAGGLEEEEGEDGRRTPCVPAAAGSVPSQFIENYMNDSLRTDVFVRFQPESIACACIYLAARTLEIPLPNRPHWFLLFGATEEEIKEICLKILQLYARKKVDLTHLEGEVEKRKHAIEEAKAQARGLLPGGTQVPDGTAGFSPAPKLAESPTEGKGSKPSPLSVKNSKKRAEGTRKAKAGSPVNGLPKGRESRSRSQSCEQSYSRSPSRSASPKRRKSDSGSTSGGSKSQSRSRSRSDSPPRQAPRSAPYKSSEIRGSRKSKDCKYPPQKPHKSRSRSSSCSRSRSRERVGNPGKYKKKSHYYRDQRRERSRSYERTGRRYERDHPGHSRHRR